MKQSKFTDEQIAFAIRQGETGTKVEETCRATDTAHTVRLAA